jgi:uncharacterized protein (DUF1501 family)
MEPINRRVFLRNGAFALLALGLPPDFLRRSALAETTAAVRRKTLICIFQRGAVDGLSMVVPFGEKAYYRDRSSIAIPAPTRGGGALDLDGFFGLNPALQPLHQLYQRHELAVIHAVGSPHPTRSHFEAQDYMETAEPGRTVGDGWLNRVLGATDECAQCAGRTLGDPAAHAADHADAQRAMAATASGVAALRGVALAEALPLSLRGPQPALALADIDHLGVAGGLDPGLEAAFQQLYRTSTGDAVRGSGADAFGAIEVLRHADVARYQPAAGVEYPTTPFGRALRQIAQLIKADVGVEIAFADLGGWDTHVAQGGEQGQLSRRLDELARSLRALHDDLGDRMDDVVVLTMSEFGRTVRENGSGGTDHGHANCMLVLGGPVAGGRVYGQWPGLEPEQCYQGRDLALTTDFRAVFAEIAARHLGASGLNALFPGYTVDPTAWRGVLKA